MLEKIINIGLALGKTSDGPQPTAIIQQHQQLRKLLLMARKTAFGQHYNFTKLLAEKHLEAAYQNTVPHTEYDAMYRNWWKFSREDEADVTWPGKIPYFALSSGTSGAASKYIPVTNDLITEMKKGTRRMFCDLSKYQLPAKQFRKQMLMVGSGTRLQPENQHFIGDLSGIIGKNRPIWMAKYYRPGKLITDLPDWSDRLEAIAREAHKWDIGYVVGNPAWVQLVFEKIIAKHRLENIHEMWKSLNLFVHGGVFFEPYRKYFEKLLGQPIHYIDSYMASEGFFAYQNRPNTRSMRLLADCGVYFEFVPFTPQNFDENGELLPNAHALTLAEVEQDQQYALLISTCSGTWRYLLGDTIQFTDVASSEFKITGRTKQFLSVCGEHISVDNLNEAVFRTNQKLNAGVVEFAVAALPNKQGGWVHQWYISLENKSISPKSFAAEVDQHLCDLNDDYATERKYSLHEVQVKILPKEVFYGWLSQRGKLNGQAKIPRVLKGNTQQNWMDFVSRIEQMHTKSPAA